MSSADFLLVRPLKLDGAVSFSRASEATYWDSSGVLQTAPPNTLRITYDPADLSKAPYALVEQARENLLRHSEQLNFRPPWGASNLLTIADQAVAPDGSVTADRLVAGTENLASHYLDQEVAGSFANGDTYTFSVFARADTLDRIALDMYYAIGSTGGYRAVFNLVDGTVESKGGIVPDGAVSITRLPGGYCRCSISGTVTVAATYPTRLLTRMLLVNASRGTSWLSAGNEGVFAWGAQLESGARATSYIETGVASVTCAADVVGPGAGMVYSNVPITEPLWVAGTYALGARVRNAQNFVFESLAAGNTAALTDKTKWLPLGITNRLKMFDKAVNSQTTAPDSLTVVVKAGQLANTLTLLNAAGAEVTVTQSESGYSRKVSMVSHNVTNWYDFYYQEPQWVGDITFGDVPPYINSLLTVHVKSPGNTAALGGFFFGRAKFIGTTQWGLRAGILSYSGEEEDEFGNVTLMPRDSAKKMNFEVSIPRGYEDEVYRFMRAADNVEMVAIASTNWSMTQSYGYLGQWEVPLGIEGEKMPVEWRGLI